MKLIESIIIHDILILFPILVYQYFTLYNKNIKKEKSEIIFDFVLYISLYLSIIYKDNIMPEYQFVCIILPLIISYLNKKITSSIFISLILIEYLYKDLNNKLFLNVLLFISLLFSYIYYYKTNKEKNYLVYSSIIIVSFYLLINLIINFNIKYLINTLLSSFIYCINIIFINKSIDEAKSIIGMHMTLKEFEKEKNIKTNLFKITHEIKNPLAVVKGYLDMFDVKDKEKSTKYINIIKSEVDRSLNLLSDFSDFTKISVEKHEFIFNDLIDEVKDILIPFFNTKNVSYSFEVEDDLIIYADYNRLKQVLLNIIKNSVEACNPNLGFVSTTVFKEMNNLYIYVKDNGCGMDKETLERIKEPFYTTKEKGTGLGVSLCREIISSHNGTINYSSRPFVKTVCKITIPINNKGNNKA